MHDSISTTLYFHIYLDVSFIPGKVNICLPLSDYFCISLKYK